MSTLSVHQYRIAIIDILRGFALYGIILAHTGAVYLLELDIESHQLQVNDRTIKFLLEQFIEKKFYLIFSFLFGLSFFIQLQNALRKNSPFLFKYIWRLSILFIIGYIHNQFYTFDILQIYAILGLFLLPIRGFTSSQLLYIALILFVSSIIFFYFSKPLEYTLSYWNYPSMRLSKTLVHQLASGNFLTILSLFVLGFWAGKTKKFNRSSIDISFFKRLLVVSLLVVAVIKTILYLLADSPRNILFRNSIHFNISFLNLFLSIFYISFICLSNYYLRQLKPLWQAFVNVGRMGLTNYIAQTLFFFILFRTGLDFTEGGLLFLFILAHLFFLLQMVYSHFWFKHFKLGPLEWLWRITTDLKWQSNRQPAKQPVAAAEVSY